MVRYHTRHPLDHGGHLRNEYLAEEEDVVFEKSMGRCEGVGEKDLSPLNHMILALLKSLGSERRDYCAHVAMSVDIFDCNRWITECCWHLAGRGQGWC